MEPAENIESGGQEKRAIAKRSPVCFLIPTYKTPLLTSDLLHAAQDSGAFEGCAFALLLDASDPHLLVYRTLVENLRAKGMTVGFFVFDGTPYCGMVNRVAPIIEADSFCVLDSRHLPMPEAGGRVAEAVSRWFGTSPEPMRVGTFTEDGFYPVVTQRLIERLGYMFHPLAVGRIEAENWLLSLAEEVGILGKIEGCRLIESGADAVEIVGLSDEEDIRWTDATLEQVLEPVAEGLRKHLVR